MVKASATSRRRQLVIAASLLAAAAAAPALTLAEDAAAFPSRPITIVVPFPPGSTADLLPRLLAPVLSKSMGVPVLVENRPGASGSIGAGFVARAEASGYTLLMAPTTVLAVNPWLYKELPYNAEKDFAPIMNAASTPNIWVAYPGFPAKSLSDVVALARAKPGSISFASGGSGTSMHLCGEALKTETGVDLVHVPYKGPGPALKDVIAGQVPLMCDNLSNVLPHLRSGRLRALALAANTRHPQAPEVPTAAESGFPGLEFGAWYSFVAPARTPQAVIGKLNSEFAHALHTPAVAERLESLGLTVVADSPEHFRKFAAAELANGGRLVRAYGAKAD